MIKLRAGQSRVLPCRPVGRARWPKPWRNRGLMCSRWCSLTGWKPGRIGTQSRPPGRPPRRRGGGRAAQAWPSGCAPSRRRPRHCRRGGLSLALAFRLAPDPNPRARAGDDPYAKRNLRWTLFAARGPAARRSSPCAAAALPEGGEQGLKRFQPAEHADLISIWCTAHPGWQPGGGGSAWLARAP